MKRILFPVILACAACAQAEWGEVVVSGSGDEAPLDLSSSWKIMKKADVGAFFYSADGWNLSPAASGRTVSLVRIFGSDETAIVEGLSGVSTYTWTLSGVQRKSYTVEHRVMANSSEVQAERLTASFDFTDCEDLVISDEDMIKAVKTDSQAFSIVNDATYPWTPINGPGEGITAPESLDAAVSSAFAFKVNGKGAFSFDYVAAGAVAVYVDDVQVSSLEAGVWTSTSLETDVAGDHVVRFVLTGPGVARLRQASWICANPYAETEDDSEVFCADLRTGEVLTARERCEVLPFAWSSTNFTGLAGTDASSVAKVTVTPMSGAGDDVTAWTPETEKAVVVLESTGEGAVVWRPRRGVYEAKFEISAGGTVVHTETRILDLRLYGKGLVILIN